MCLSVFFAAWAAAAGAQQSADSALAPADSARTRRLTEAVVARRRPLLRTYGLTPGSLRMDVEQMGHTLQYFGEADALRYLALLPGVSQGSDYTSGLSVQGADLAQSVYRIDGAPVFFPYHFGGIFSTFNTAHLPDVTFEKCVHTSAFPNRLGGGFDFQSRPDAARTTLHTGLTASSLTFSRRLTPRFSLAASARVSYLNLLYAHLLESSASSARFDFYDLNLTARWQPSAADVLTLSGYRNADRLRYTDSHYALTTTLRWTNNAWALTWQRRRRLTWQQRAWVSHFGSRLGLELPQAAVAVPSAIVQGGSDGVLTTPPLLRHGRLSVSAGYAAEVSAIRPQSVSATGFGSPLQASAVRRMSLEGRLFADAQVRLLPDLTASAGLKLSAYCRGAYATLAPDPQLTVVYTRGAHRLTAQLARFHQFLHQVGFSDIGMASNFWIGADRHVPAARSLSGTVSYAWRPAGGRYALTLEAYAKRVRRAPEYSGLILDLLADHYDARNHILSGSGYNCGVELMVAKLSGRLTGWVSYAWGAARRRFSGTADRRLTDAVTSPGHVFSLFTRLALTPRLDAGAVFNLRSGRPTTPVRAIYMVGQNVLTEYGRRNSVRLPLYHRLDLFLNYRFAPRRASGLRHALALSVLNAYGRNNPEIRSYRYDPEHNTYRLHEVSSLYRFMPSLSYTLTF